MMERGDCASVLSRGDEERDPRRSTSTEVLSWCGHVLSRSLYIHMAILLLVPIAFLAYSATRLTDRAQQVEFASRVTPILQGILECGHRIQDERSYTSSFLTNVGSPTEAFRCSRLVAKRALADESCTKFVRIIELSDAILPLLDIQKRLMALERMRTRADTLTVDLEATTFLLGHHRRN